MTPAQPFSYQQSSHACWITSMHNALLHLYGEKSKVPHSISRRFYFGSSDDGVSTGDMNKIIEMLRNEFALKIFSYRNRQITKVLVRRLLSQKDTVMVCDTNAGTHSLLMTGIEGEEVVGFDPNWGNVVDCAHSAGRFRCCPYGDNRRALLNPRHNVAINIAHLMKDPPGKKDRFAMGGVSSRMVLALSHP